MQFCKLATFEQFPDDVTYRKYLEGSSSIQYLAISVMTIITPAILHFNRFLPIIISVAFIVFSTIFLCFIKLEKREEKQEEKITINIRTLRKGLKVSSKLNLFILLGFNYCLFLN